MTKKKEPVMDLDTIAQMNAIDVFHEDRLQPLLKAIKQAVTSEVPDLETQPGRDRIKSLAYKVSRTKTVIDNMGKELTSDWKAKAKVVDDSRAVAREFLDDLRDETRKPVTDWEGAEKNRLNAIHDSIDIIKGYSDDGSAGSGLIHEKYNADELKERLVRLTDIVIHEDQYQEFTNEAGNCKERATEALEGLLVAMLIFEAEQAELQDLRDKAAEQERKDEIKRLADEVIELERIEAEKAVAAANAATEAAQEKAVNDKLEAERRRVRDAEDASIARVEAAELAEANKAAAVQAEKDRQAREKQQEEDDLRMRTADLNHKGAINSAALQCFVANGFELEDARKIVGLVVMGKIENIVINY
jgi:hypothetical protein